MAKVLVIDDDPDLRDMVSLALEDGGHEVITADNGVIGLRKATESGPEIVVSDVNMPGMDGFTLCQRMRASGMTVPIILLTARDNELDQALGLDLGADDYVIKPFSGRVLNARVASLLRREQLRKKPAEATALMKIGRLELDTDRMEARYAGQPIEVTVTELRFLVALTSRPGVVYTRSQLLDRVRGDESVVAERLVDTYIRRIRRKIEKIEPGFEEIETVIGAGYRWRK